VADLAMHSGATIRVAPDLIFSISLDPDPDWFSEVESSRSQIRIPGVVDNGTLVIKKTQNINLELVHCFVLEVDTVFCSLM
jgi:hypothetical protein